MGKTLLRSDFNSDIHKRGGRKIGTKNKVKAKRKYKNPTPISESNVVRPVAEYSNKSPYDKYDF